MPQGTAIVDFGAFPGSSDASVAVTGQTGILSSSLVEAWIRPVDSADNLADEHLVETIRIVAGNIVPGTGFTIYAFNSNPINEPLETPGASTFRPAATTVHGYVAPSVGGRGTLISCKYNVAWVWN